MHEMMKLLRTGIFASCALAMLGANGATAGDRSGDFMIRVLGTGVITQDSVNSLTLDAPGASLDLRALGLDAEVSNEFIPATTLTYFLNNNLAIELFCCFAKHDIDLKDPVLGLSGEVADFWIFPPALTLQYHFTGMGGLKPYVGAGVQYIAFFDESVGNSPLGGTGVDIDSAFGFVLQAGIDVEIGNGWYLNADVKKTWLDTEAQWQNVLAAPGLNVNADVDVDPLIVSAGIGYRFNLSDIFGRRGGVEPLK